MNSGPGAEARVSSAPMEPGRRLRVTFVLPSLLVGGIERHLVRMLARFDRARFELSVITLFDYPGLRTLHAELPADVRAVRLAFRNGLDGASWMRLATALGALAPDVAVGSMFSANAAIRLLKPSMRYRVVTREHNFYDDKKWYHRVFDHVLSWLSDGMVAVSRMVADYASRQALIPRGRIAVINNGVDFDRIRAFAASAAPEAARVRAELGLAPDRRIVLNVARLKPQKNHDLLIEAFERFRRARPEFVLVVAGDGQDRARLTGMVRERGLGERIRILGPRADVDAFYAAAELFALSSRREGFPNVGLEAMAFGLPFVTTPVSGVDEFVQDGLNGFVAAAEPDAFAAALERAAALPPAARARMSAACIETARRFDMAVIVRKYEDFLLGLRGGEAAP